MQSLSPYVLLTGDAPSFKHVSIFNIVGTGKGTLWAFFVNTLLVLHYQNKLGGVCIAKQ
jgi:hypothetical protein